MNIKEIEKLLEKYEEGETTLQEEQYLKGFFNGTDIPENLQSYRTIFSYYSRTKKEHISDPEFERKSDRRLTGTPVTRINFKKQFTYIFSFAASILIVIGLFFTFRQDTMEKDLPQPVTSDPAYAMAEVEDALLSVSVNLNIGLSQLQRFETIGEALKSIQKFSKFYQYQSMIINQDLQPITPLNQ